MARGSNAFLVSRGDRPGLSRGSPRPMQRRNKKRYEGKKGQKSFHCPVVRTTTKHSNKGGREKGGDGF